MISSFLASLVDLAGTTSIVDTYTFMLTTGLCRLKGRLSRLTSCIRNRVVNKAWKSSSMLGQTQLRASYTQRGPLDWANWKVQAGNWTKHHLPLHIPSTFHLPMSCDGVERTTEQYLVIGLLCHVGQEHEQGHFFAVLVYRGCFGLLMMVLSQNHLWLCMDPFKLKSFKFGRFLRKFCYLVMSDVNSRWRTESSLELNHRPNAERVILLNFRLAMPPIADKGSELGS